MFDARRDNGARWQRPLALGFSVGHTTFEAAHEDFQKTLFTVQLPTSLQISRQMINVCDDVFKRYVDEHRTRKHGADGATTISEHRWLSVYYLVVSADVVRRADGEAAILVELIEREIIRRAREAGYTAVYGENMSSVTIVC